MIKIFPLIGAFLLLTLWIQPVHGQNGPEQETKLFSFGVIADVQYADAEQVGKRNYRGSLAKLEKTVQRLNQYKLSFIASLGDLIDRDFESFVNPLALMSNAKAPIHHVLGNHEFSVDDAVKKEVPGLLNNPEKYYSFEIHGFVMVILNGMEESIGAYPQDSKQHREGLVKYEYLKSTGANNAHTYNGGLGKEQFKWLAKVLSRADKMCQRVILFSHFPLLPENGLQLWENRKVLQLLNKHNSVVAYFSGHHHEGNYVQEKAIHYLTFKGMVEAKSESSFGIIDVYKDRLVITGFGDQEDRTLKFALKNINSGQIGDQEQFLPSR